MILFIILLLILVLLLVGSVILISVCGAGVIWLFGDVIVCGVLIVLVMKRIITGR